MNPVQERQRRELEQKLREIGGVEKLGPAPDGPIVNKFAPGAIARAIEQEVARAKLVGWTKISIHMDLEDALALALALRIR
jgi:hypothetical protein